MKHFTKKVFNRIFLAFMVASLMMTSMVMPAGAADYYLTDDELYNQYMPKSYDVTDVIMSVDNQRIKFDAAEDMYINEKDNVYVADTNNNRIIMLDSDMKYVRTYPAKNAGAKAQLNTPKGVYVDGDGDVFVADTGNKRIVHYSPNGEYVEEFTQPKEETYDTNYPFEPLKVYVDQFGIIYVINNRDPHGIITMKATGEFLGYVGTIKTDYDLVQSLVRMFGSETQIELYGQNDPDFYLNMAINGDGTIYATSSEPKNQIKRLTPAGDNVYEENTYGETVMNEQFEETANFIDIAVDKDGMVFAADSNTGRIYIYDQTGNSVAVFGGQGQMEMSFRTITAMCINSKNEIYVLDSTLNTVQKLSPTDFMENVLKAVNLYNNGKYEEAMVPWQEVLDMASNYKLAQVGIAKSDLRAGNNEEALSLYKSANDKEGYSEAFEQIRMDFFRAHFGWIVLIILASLAVLFFIISKLRKYANKIADTTGPVNDKYGVKFFIETCVCVLVHPMDAFYRVKYNRKSLRVWPIILMLAVMFVEKILFRMLIHFPLTDSSIFIDYFRDMVLFFLPLLSWICVAYAITSISDGKQTFIETASCTLYSFVPYMILYIPITALSNIMGTSESGLYNGMQLIILVWSLLLIFCNFKILNEYSFKKAVFNILKILFAILCLWILIFLMCIVVSQLFVFIDDVYTEIVYMTK